MSFATYYDYHGEIKRVGKNELSYRIDELTKENEECWEKIALLMAMTPMDQKCSDGGIVNWVDYIQDQLRELREVIEDNQCQLVRLWQAKECMTLDPKSVHDDADEWDEEKDDWKE